MRGNWNTYSTRSLYDRSSTTTSDIFPCTRLDASILAYAEYYFKPPALRCTSEHSAISVALLHTHSFSHVPFILTTTTLFSMVRSLQGERCSSRWMDQDREASRRHATAKNHCRIVLAANFFSRLTLFVALLGTLPRELHNVQGFLYFFFCKSSTYNT